MTTSSRPLSAVLAEEVVALVNGAAGADAAAQSQNVESKRTGWQTDKVKNAGDG
jgi:hypothetical protein